ncbi:unnamed protein product [Cuscuta campestris]|uniref:K Homology domain-containing protein n=1 Tax=Cuscuta campestris TaxID=132261 RepID=A0A484LWD2_9ASTE|nr:unnamed protein product [Cuscuta campestris]
MLTYVHVKQLFSFLFGDYENCPEWTVFRLLISTNDEVAMDCHESKINLLKSLYAKKKVEVDFHSVATGVGVVMVSAKRDSMRSILHAVTAFDEVHRYFLHSMPYEQCVTRLLVPAAHAKKLIILYTMKPHPSRLSVYLSGNMTGFFPGDVIVDVSGRRDCVLETVDSVVSYLGEFGVEESMKSELNSRNCIRPSNHGACVPEKAERKSSTECSLFHDFTRIPLRYTEDLIGKDGANMKKIRESCPEASVYLETFTLKQVVVSVKGKCYLDVKGAEDVLEGLIPDEKKDGEYVFEGMFRMTALWDTEAEMDDDSFEEEEEPESSDEPVIGGCQRLSYASLLEKNNARADRLRVFLR